MTQIGTNLSKFMFINHYIKKSSLGNIFVTKKNISNKRHFSIDFIEINEMEIFPNRKTSRLNLNYIPQRLASGN